MTQGNRTAYYGGKTQTAGKRSKRRRDSTQTAGKRRDTTQMGGKKKRTHRRYHRLRGW